MLTGTFEELFAAGCIQTGADVCDDLEEAKPKFRKLFMALSLVTHGDICNGCPAFKGGSCKAYRTYHTAAMRQSSPLPRTTNKTANRCTICGLKIRGKNHDQGEHHQRAMKSVK